MKTNILALIFFFLITIIVTDPLVFNLKSLIIDPFDGLLINWIINWSINHPLDLNANIFFPFKNTLAYSDFHLISVLTSAPLILVFKEPLLAFNTNFFLGYFLTAFSTFILVKKLTSDARIAVLAGTLFSFGIIHVNYQDHLQLLGFWPFILTLYFFYRAWKIPFVLTFFLSVATMPLFFFFFMAFFLIAPKKNLKTTLFAFAVSLTVFIPYFQVSRQFNYVRPITDAVNFSLKFQDFFAFNTNSRLSLFTGVSAIIILVWLVIKHSKLNRFLILGIVSVILAFGPALHIFRNTIHVGAIPFIPLPYAFLYYLLPGFSGFRTPSRWLLLAFFALVIGFSVSFKRRLNPKVIAVLILITIFEINLPLSFTKIPTRENFPPEQRWLESNYSGKPLIQFPIYGWFNGEKIGVETLRMHYSITQNHPMFNGYSGFSPKSWEKNVQQLQKDFPTKNTISFLKSQKIALVLTPVSWREKMLKFKEFKLVKTFPKTDIWLLK